MLRQIIHVNWDMYIRDPTTYMNKAKEILGDHANCWMPKPMREINTRWGSNCKACKNILEGLYIVNDDRDSFWVLFFKEMASIYNEWKTGRLEELVTMLMMKDLQVNLALEYEAGRFFEAQQTETRKRTRKRGKLR